MKADPLLTRRAVRLSRFTAAYNILEGLFSVGFGVRDESIALACIKLSGVLLAGSAVQGLSPSLWWADSAAALVRGRFCYTWRVSMRLHSVALACAFLSLAPLVRAETVASPGGLDFHRPGRIYIVAGWCEFFDLRQQLPYYDDPGLKEMAEAYATSSKAWKALVDWYSTEACTAFQKTLRDRFERIYYNPEIIALERPPASRISAAVADEALSGLVLIDHGWKGGRFYHAEKKSVLPDDFPERRAPVDFFGGAFCFSGHKGGGHSLKSWLDILRPTYSYAYDHVTWPGEILEDTKILLDELAQERRGQELNLMRRVMRDCKAGRKNAARWAAKKPFCDEVAAWGFLGDPDRFEVEALSAGQKSTLHSVYLLYMKEEP